MLKKSVFHYWIDDDERHLRRNVKNETVAFLPGDA